MYEKGSVRAEPRSNKQERMKKIMKKFLSSLLALTMILSLVIVPARATDTISGKSSVTKGSQITLTAPSAPSKVTVGQTEYNVKSGAEVGYAWRSSSNSVATVSDSSTTGTVTGVAAGTATITCTMTLTYIKVAADSSKTPAVEEQTDTTQVSYNKEVTVTDPQGDFANAVSIKVQGNEYKDGLKYIGDTLSANDIDVTLKSTASSDYNNFTVPKKDVSGTTATIQATAKTKNNVDVTFNKQITVTYATGAVSIKADGKNTDPATPIVVVSNQEVALAASYAGNDSATCKWTGNGGFSQNTSKAPTWTAPESSSSSGDEYTLTCTFTDGSVVKTGTVKFKVVKDHYKAMPADGNTSFVLTPNKKSETIATPYIQDTNPGGTVYTSGVTFD